MTHKAMTTTSTSVWFSVPVLDAHARLAWGSYCTVIVSSIKFASENEEGGGKKGSRGRENIDQRGWERDFGIQCVGGRGGGVPFIEQTNGNRETKVTATWRVDVGLEI